MRKLFVVLSALMVVALLLSACAGAAPAPAAEAPAAEAPAEGAAAEPTPEPTPVVNAFGQCDDPLRLWHGLTGSDGAVFSEMLQKFARTTRMFASSRKAFRGISSSRSIPPPWPQAPRLIWSSSTPPRSSRWRPRG